MSLEAVVNDKPRRSPTRTSLAASSPASGGSRRHRPDHWIIVLTALLMTVGLVTVYSISPGLSASQHISQSYFITKQLIAVALGIAAFIVSASLPMRFWQKITKPLAITAVIVSLVVVLTPMDAVYQAHRWIRLGSYSFQVAELIKLALLLFTAGFLRRQWQAGKNWRF